MSPGADCHSDHVPIIANMKVKRKILKKPTRIAKKQYELLNTDQNLKESLSVSLQQTRRPSEYNICRREMASNDGLYQ